MARFQHRPIGGQPFLDGEGPSNAWDRWFDLIEQFLSSAPNFVTVPTSSTATGKPGQMAYDTTFLYVCVNTNSWLRSPLSTF